MGDPQRRNSGGGRGGGWQPRGRGRGYFRNVNGNQGHRAAAATPLVESQGSQQVITDMLEVSQGPYSGWRLYHKQETEQRKRRSPNWGEAETQLLLQLWAERITEMKTIKRNGFMLEEMAQMLQASGFARSSAEVKTRIANLSQEYRMELRKRTLGFPHGNFRLWDSVHAILGGEEGGGSANSSFTDQQLLLAEAMAQQVEQHVSNQQGGESGAESLCCDIDPGMLIDQHDAGNDDTGEDHENEEITPKMEEHHTSPLDNLPNVPSSLTISLASAPSHHHISNGNNSSSTPGRIPGLIRVKRGSVDSERKVVSKRPRLSVDSALFSQQAEPRAAAAAEDRADTLWAIMFEQLRESNQHAEIRASNLTKLMEQQIRLQKQGLKLQKRILTLLEAKSPQPPLQEQEPSASSTS